MEIVTVVVEVCRINEFSTVARYFVYLS